MMNDGCGFFLRYDYFVDFIGESTSNKSILVDVGGVKSSIATQYVSNHDFLEVVTTQYIHHKSIETTTSFVGFDLCLWVWQDEIKAWWNRSLGSGRRIPSLAELNSKFNNRHTLGRPTMDGGRRTEQ